MTGNTKLSALGLVAYALRAIPANFGVLAGLCAPALLIVIGGAVIGRLYFPSPPDAEGPMAELAGPLPILGFAGLVANVALIPAFTGWHRHLILGDATRENGRAFGWDMREWRYLGIVFGIWCLMFLTNIVANLMISILASPALIVPVALTAIAVYLLIWATFGLALPAAALGHRRSMAEIGRMVAGNKMKIALGLGWTWLLLGLAAVVATVVMTFVAEIVGGIFLTFVFVMLFYYLALVASVGVLSRAYVLLAANAGPPSGQ